jgi:hypothetical protein
MMEDLAENEEHDDQPPVRPLREIIKVNNTEKPDLGDILVPNDQDQQNAQRRVTTGDSTHLQVR